MKRPAGILFDLGDTLMRIETMDIRRGMTRLFEVAEGHDRITLEAMLEGVGRLQRDWQILVEQTHLEYSFAALLRNIDARLGLRHAMSMTEAEQTFWDAAVKMYVEPGVEAMLDYLDREKIPYAILSNSVFSETTLRTELRRAGLEPRFAFVMASTDFGMQKPHPELYVTAAARLGLAPAEILFVGDSLLCDVAGPQKAGMSATWYNPGGSPKDEDVKPALEIQQWDDLVWHLDHADDDEPSLDETPAEREE